MNLTMKIKSLLLAILAVSAITILAASCGGNGKKDTESTAVALPEPTNVENAQSFQLDPTSEGDKVQVPFKTIKEFAEFSASEKSAKADDFVFELKEITVIPGDKVVMKFSEFQKTKASSLSTIIALLSYTKSGNTLNIPGFGTVEIASGSLKITLKGGGSYNTPYKTIAAKFNYKSGLEIANILRPLKVDKTDISVTGGGLSQKVGKIFTGCDFNEIADYAIKNGVSFDKDQIEAGLKVNVISLDIFGNFIVTFTGHSPYGGSISSLSSSAISGLSWIEKTGNVFLDNPTITYACVSKNIILTCKSKIVKGSNSYDCTVEFTLSPA